MSEIIKVAPSPLHFANNKPLDYDGFGEAGYIESMGRKVWCDRCQKLVSRVLVDIFPLRGKVTITADCHGETESTGFTIDEFNQVIRGEFKAVVFKKPTVTEALTNLKGVLEDTNRKE